MININGASTLTITAANNQIYSVVYENLTTVDIFNHTESDIYVNSDGAFSEKNGVGNYLTIPAGGSYNGFRPDIGGSICIRANSAGKISVVKKRY